MKQVFHLRNCWRPNWAKGRANIVFVRYCKYCICQVARNECQLCSLSARYVMRQLLTRSPWCLFTILIYLCDNYSLFRWGPIKWNYDDDTAFHIINLQRKILKELYLNSCHKKVQAVLPILSRCTSLSGFIQFFQISSAWLPFACRIKLQSQSSTKNVWLAHLSTHFINSCWCMCTFSMFTNTDKSFNKTHYNHLTCRDSCLVTTIKCSWTTHASEIV